jgi:hypothetical protein
MATELADSRRMEDGGGSTDGIVRRGVEGESGARAPLTANSREGLRDFLALRYSWNCWRERGLVVHRFARAVRSVTRQLRGLRLIDRR